jgi:hypothetical protein
MILPKDLNQLILEYTESPRIPELLYQCWKEQLKHGNGYFCVKTKYMISPYGPDGRSTFSDGWTSHMVFTITRHTIQHTEVVYKYEIEVVWRQNGKSSWPPSSRNGLSVFSKEYEEDNTTFPLDFYVLDTLPRACKDAPEFFVGHVWDMEVITSGLYAFKLSPPFEHLNHGGFSFEAKAMLEIVESRTS